MKDTFFKTITNINSDLKIVKQNFSNQIISNIDLQCFLLVSVKFSNCEFQNVDFTGSSFVDCFFENCTFKNVTVRKSQYWDCTLKNTQIYNSISLYPQISLQCGNGLLVLQSKECKLHLVDCQKVKNRFWIVYN